MLVCLLPLDIEDVKRIIEACISYLKGLEGEANVVALGHRDPPYAHLVGPIVIWVVGRLDLPVVLLHLPTTDG